MIYKYYCVNCGNRMNGEDIRFDLSELVGVRDASDENTTANPAALISPAQLEANAEAEGGKPLVHGQLCPITMSLRTYLGILGLYTGKTKEMRAYGYNDDDLTDAVSQLVKTNENAEAAGEKIGEYVATIKNLFVADRAHEGSENNDDYKRTFYVKPEYFENGRSKYMYSLEYAYDVNSPNTKKIRAPQPIRGYCPKCGKPILVNAGKYPHVLVGLLGAQSAGKTTMILSMLQEIEHSFSDLNIEFPGNVLCDSRYSITRQNQELFNKGWLPLKTNATGVNSFNASLLIEKSNSHDKMLLTFADIAGEQCYDPETNAINLDATEKFPLINSCDVYILCTCLDRTQYVRADNVSEEQAIDMPPQAVMMIANGIYGNLRSFRKQAHKTPPLCIVMTKADVVNDAKAQAVVRNPFDEIKVVNSYRYKSQLDNLSLTYKTFGEDKIREPLDWCCKAYTQMKDKTYLSMMACSATGRVGDVWEGKDTAIPMNKNGRFKSMGIKDLVQWVFQAIGLSPIMGNYQFLAVPSHDEKYYKSTNGENFRQGHFTDKGAGARCTYIPCVFMNPTKTDADIYKASRQPEPTRSWFGTSESPTLTAIRKAQVLLNE